ncbi:alpha/beta hydrolase [Paracraurococcus lichenis]|uniref:Alpha/beta hydrolase n=1 Tax=Paracraurococcus lichenis TaxID=3064888 RepID=A0ABT9E5H8_9PROT|nr:alpha/beta hydrolase [Paracraurococcus sp. LOR1-02]MDO9711408.1 alpha/beta hydrolase [Paracraurococcus sp. LOR1-02]
MPIKVFFATNRAGPLPTPVGTRDRADHLRFGEAEVEAKDWLGTELDRRVLAIRETGTLFLSDASPAPAASAALQAWFAAAAEGVPLLLVHGFANGFEGTLKRAAQIVQFYEGGDPAVQLVPLVFAWPSLGTTLGALQSLDTAEKPYHDDQTMAAASGPALARLLHEILLARPAAGTAADGLTLLAHSMGNWVLHHALAALGYAPLAGPFRHALQMAADADWQVWAPGQPLRRLATLAQAVTIGTNADPVLQTVSGIANHGGKRLGHYGPLHLGSLPASVTVLDCLDGINGVDTARIKSQGGTEWDSIWHQYYRNNQNVRAYLTAVFAGAGTAELDAMRLALAPAERWSDGDGSPGMGRGRTHALLPVMFQDTGPPPTQGIA